MGRLVRTLYPARPTYTFDLPAGIYIIRTEIAHDQKDGETTGIVNKPPCC